MAISFSQTALLTCPQCNTPFDADIWLIVDAGERPDLVARCHDGSIHVVACPNNHSGMLPAPLLYHDRAKQQLFLAYPQNMSEEQVQEVGKQLVHQLRNQLLALPNSGYLDAPRALPIELLPAAMDDKQDEVMAEMQAQFEKLRNDPAIAAAARVLQEHRALGETIQEWINLDAWNTSKEFLATHPELLTNDADLVLAAMLDLARAQDDADAQEDLQVHREIARDARENGIDAAYEKYVARGANDERASDARAQLQARLAELNIHSQQELERALPDHPELQELLARAMRQENPILQAIEKLMETRSPQEVIQLARIYPLLLDDDGMNAIREIISNARERGDEGMANHLQERFAILEQIKASGARPDDLAQIAAIEQSLDDETRAAIEELRALGISNEQELQAALEKRPDLRAKLERAAQASAVSPGDVPDDVRSILQEISRLTRLPDMPRKIELCRAALERITREQNQNLWAGLNGELANALNQNPQGSRAENLEEAIRHYELALEVYTRVAFPEQWSGTQNNLANAYKNRIRGERADNLEEAIRHFELALEVYTRAAFPTDWAMTQNNLANAYRNRIRGERAENLEEAIRHFELALEVYTRAAFPEQWATTQNNLALAYSDRIRGERADNLEEAIRHFELALEVYTRAAFPEQWATTQNNLALAYSDRIRGERADNLEEAIRHYELALEVYTRAAFPEQWATTQNNLATAYSDRIRGERADNLEEAIRHFELALEVYTRAAFPTDWAGTQNNLANAYRNRIRGERAENLEEAIRHYELALEVYTRAAFPEQWATTQNNLANAYKNRIRGERADNLEEAIRHFELALEVYTRAAFPTDWAMTQNNLANAYSNRIRGERADNLEEAIRHYELALEVRTRAAFPEQWATTQNNLATAYADRIRGERADNLEEAIRHYELALEVYTRAAFPEQWSGTQNNLGEAYRNRIRGERADNLEEAIRHYELALEVRTRAAFPEQWATTQNNLATAYSDRILGKRADNLEEAIRHCELALEVRTRAAFPTDWGMTQNNLANAYLYRIRGERADNLEAAIRHFEQALLEYTPKNFPERARTTSLNLAAVGETREDWRAVHRALTTAAAAGERLFLATVSQFGEQTEAQELAHLYDRDLLVCLRLIAADAEVARDALSDAEAARSRAFLRQLSLGDFAPPASIPAPLVGQEKNILAQLRATQNDLARLVAPRDLKPKTEGTLTDRMSEMERALTERRKQLLDEVERVRNDMLSASPDAADYVSLRRAETPKWNDLSALAARVGKDAALVEFHLLNDQTLAFVWRAGWDNPKMLSLPLTRERLLHRYLLPYEREVLNIYRRSQAQASGRELYHDWLGLGEELLAPLEPLLGDASLVYFIPHQFLHLLPLHALTVNGEPFIARRAVAYAPSAAVLGRVLDPKGFGNPSGLGGALVMSYSEIDWQNDWFMDEARQVAALFGAIPLANASRDTLESRAPDASLIHLLAHGLYDREDSLNSGVALKGGIFTARDWMRLDLRADLVTLASCELGFSDVNPGDDVVGMTRALLYAGASSVLLALWSVYAKTTVKWMLDFYQRIKPDATPQAKAYAFQDATLALRAQDNDPYVWAPFVLVGNWM